MSNELYQQFLSTGFAELNRDSGPHMISLYRHNYARFLPKNKQAKILEIGCGLGQFLEFLGQSGFDDILGVDISSEAIDYCRSKGILKARLISDLADFLNVCPMYDLIILNDVIEHFPREDVLSNLEKIYQKLNIGGQVIIKTGNMASLAGLRIRYNDFTHYGGFTEYSLTQVLKFSKFRHIMIYAFVFPKNRLTRIIRFLGQKLIHGIWKLIFFFEYTAVPKTVDELIFAVAKK